MKFEVTKAWLERKLREADDAFAAAGGTELEDLKRNVERRSITKGVLEAAPTKLGKVICYVREQKGWSRLQLAQIAKLDLTEIEFLEMRADYSPSPRAVSYLADALELSKEKLQVLAGFVAPDAHLQHGLRFAANSKSVDSISDEQYEAVRALVEVLAERK
jgi:transcriptional regulator with XRE-family HTH domain